MSCRPELVTGYVDEALDAHDRKDIEAHLAECEACRDQATSERDLRQRLRSLPAPAPPGDLEERVRSRLKGVRTLSWVGYLLPVAAALLIAFLWARGNPSFVAWELSADHNKCFHKPQLPAKVWSSDVVLVTRWFERQGTTLPLLPSAVDDADLVGARYCPLPSATLAPHVYYTSDRQRFSVFVVPHGVRITQRFATNVLGNGVRLVRVGSSIVGVVGRDGETLNLLERKLTISTARNVEELLASGVLGQPL